jgi:hypothetical protein
LMAYKLLHGDCGFAHEISQRKDSSKPNQTSVIADFCGSSCHILGPNTILPLM